MNKIEQTEVAPETPTAEVWEKEIELQKMYGLSPKEAYVFTSIEVHGKTYGETAEVMGAAIGTVKTLYSRAKKKVEPKVKLGTRTFVIPNLPSSDRGKGYKDPVIKKVCYFLEAVCGTKFYRGEHSMMIAFSSEQIGDLAWYKANIATKISVVGTGFDSDNKCKNTAEKMTELVYANGAIDKIGWGILKYHLDQMYVHYDVYEDLS